MELQWGGLDDSGFIAAAVADAKSDDPALAEAEIRAEIAAYLSAHPDTKLQRVCGADYTAKMDGRQDKEVEIGPDIWLAR